MTTVTWQLTPWVMADLLAAGVMISVGILAWRRRPMSGATPFGILALAVAVWAIANAFYFSSTDVALRLFWNRIKFLGVDAVALAWLAFVLAYAGRSARLTRLGWGLIGAVPLISTLLHWARDLDARFLANGQLDPIDVSFPIQSVYDAWYPLHLISTYLLIGVGVLVLFGTLADRSSRLFRGQLIALLVGVIVPWLGDVPITLGLLPPEFETTPLALAVSALAFAYALFRYQLFNMVPAAYASVIANMADGLIVLDWQGRIVEVNPAAAGALCCQPAQVFGRPLAEIQPDWPVVSSEPLGPICSLPELVLAGTENRCYFELHQSPVVNQRGQPAGRVIVMHDVTRRVRTEEALRESEKRLQEAEQQTQGSLREKEMLLKEIHHRVKNNLQIVSSLLYLQAELVNDDRARHLLEESQNRVKSLAMIHEQLYQSPDLARIDFTRYVRNLASYLFDAHMINPEEINLVVNVANVALEVDVATPCSLIINELLSNALKHAFPGGTAVSGRRPEIRIMLHPVDGNCALVVSDNGVGLPADLDPCSTTSLGLQIVEVLTRQLKGTIEVDRQGGTAFKITFPWSQGPRTTARSLSD